MERNTEDEDIEMAQVIRDQERPAAFGDILAPGDSQPRRRGEQRADRGLDEAIPEHRQWRPVVDCRFERLGSGFGLAGGCVHAGPSPQTGLVCWRERTSRSIWSSTSSRL